MTKDAAKWIEEVNGLLKHLLNCGSVTGFDKQMKYLITNKPDNSINVMSENEQTKNIALREFVEKIANGAVPIWLERDAKQLLDRLEKGK